MLKCPSPSRASLVRHSLYKLNRIGDKQHSCRTPLPIYTLLVSHRSSCTLTLSSMYNLLINLLSRQLIPVLFRICINLLQFMRSNAFCQSKKQTHIHLPPKFVLILFLSYQLHPWFIFLFQIETDLLQVHLQFSFQSFF